MDDPRGHSEEFTLISGK